MTDDNPRGRNYWEMVKDAYPHFVAVKHMSDQDMDPRKVSRRITYDFKRVTFGGMSYFGFMHQRHLEQFKKAVGL
jgi:hypothetical protein